MSYNNGPKIINSGLVAAYDFGNIKSFKGEPTTNLEANPITFSLWTSGATTTVTASYTTAPDGNNTATRVYTTGYWGSIISSPSNSTVYTWSIYLKSATTSVQYVTCLFEDNGDYNGTFVSTTFTVTPYWQRFAIVATTAAATSSPRFSIRNGDLLAWGIQLEQKSYATNFVVGTRGSTVGTGGGLFDLTRIGSNGTISGAPISTSSYGGGLTFNGTSDYVTIPNPLNQSNLTQEWTVNAWLSLSTSPANNAQYLIEGLNSGIAADWYQSAPLLYLNGGANDYYRYGNAGNYIGAGIINLTFRFQNASGTRILNKNTIDISGSGPNNTSTPSGQAANFRLGYQMKGVIYLIQIYNRMLTNDEVIRNYNVSKKRFGL